MGSQLESYIATEERAHDRQGFLSDIVDLCYPQGKEALAHLKELSRKQTSQDDLDQAVKTYQQTENKINLTKEFVEGVASTAPLFLPGLAGALTSSVVGALDQMKLSDNSGTNVENAAMGAIRGLSKWSVANYFGQKDWSFAAKGAALGAGMFAVDNMFARGAQKYGSYLNPDPDASFGAILAGAATSAAAGAMLGGFNAALGGKISNSVFGNVVGLAGITGFGVGAVNEMVREARSPIDSGFSFTNIMEHGLVNGAAFGLGAVPAAKMAEANIAASNRSSQSASESETPTGAQEHGSSGTETKASPVRSDASRAKAASEPVSVDSHAQGVDMSNKTPREIDLYNDKQHPDAKDYQLVGRLFRGRELGAFEHVKAPLPNGEVVKASGGDIVELDSAGRVVGAHDAGVYTQFTEEVAPGIYRNTDYWIAKDPIVRAEPISTPPKQAVWNQFNEEVQAQPGDYLVRTPSGKSWVTPKSEFEDEYWEVPKQGKFARIAGSRAWPTDETVENYLKTHGL